MRQAMGVCGVMVLLAVGDLLGAPPVDPLTEAEQLVSRLEFERAARVLEELIRSPAEAPMRLTRAYHLLAHARVATADPEGAERAFFELLKLDPAFRLDPLASPKLHRALREVRPRLNEGLPKLLDSELVDSEEALVLALTFLDPLRMIEDVTVYWRVLGGSGFAIAKGEREADPPAKEPRFAASLPDTRGKDEVEYYAETYTRAGVLAARVGSREALVIPRVQLKSEATAWYAQWWVWTAVGVAVAGAATAAVVLSTGDDDSLGTLRLP